MSKPIKLTDELLRRVQQEFIAEVKDVKMLDGKIGYSRTFKWADSENDRAAVYMSATAFAKMNMLIQNFDSEVAWHGVVHRDEEVPNVFHITDILVYPQTVTGATVNTDQRAYETWLYSFNDDIFNHIRMQGHSHVDMDVFPSGVDMDHQRGILEQITGDDYYIFMIWNKRYEHFVRVFDFRSNTLYDTEDVDVYIGEAGVNLNAFLANAKEVVKQQTYTLSYQSGTSASAATAKPAHVKSKPTDKVVAESGKSSRKYRPYAFFEYGRDDADGYI